MRRCKDVNLTMDTYQFWPLGTLVVPQMFSEVLVIHELEDEGEWVFLGGINPHEWDETPAAVAEATTNQHFLVQPLRVTMSSLNA